MSRTQKLRKERGSNYGPVRQNHRSIGLIWTGILIQAGWTPPPTSPVLPPEKVTLMMVGVKCSREAYKHLSDNIDDGQNYLAFTGELAEEDHEKEAVAADRVQQYRSLYGDRGVSERQPDKSTDVRTYHCCGAPIDNGEHAYHCPTRQ